jgi:hypothetical protein
VKKKKVTMNLVKALKTKNRLVQRLSEAQSNVHKWNSFREDLEPDYKADEELDRVVSISENLAVLKAGIQFANGPISLKLQQLAEMKARVSFLGRIDTKSGPHKDRYDQEEPDNYRCIVDRPTLDKSIRLLEDDIDKVQDQVEKHNAKTKITVELHEE